MPWKSATVPAAVILNEPKAMHKQTTIVFLQWEGGCRGEISQKTCRKEQSQLLY